MIRASGLRPSCSTARSLATTVAAAPSVMPGALPAVTVPSVASPRSSPVGRSKTGFSFASASARCRARALVGGDDRLALRPRDRHGRHLVVEAARVLRSDRALMALERERVLVLAAHVVLDRDALRVGAHVALLDRAPQAVVDRRVEELALPSR